MEDERWKMDARTILSFVARLRPRLSIVDLRSSIFDLPSPLSRLDHVIVVLNEPQDPINIAATVRAMKNMGVRRLRLVNPVQYDPWRIEGVAHGTRDLVDQIVQ